jgi:hypothetical protein
MNPGLGVRFLASGGLDTSRDSQGGRSLKVIMDVLDSASQEMLSFGAI